MLGLLFQGAGVVGPGEGAEMPRNLKVETDH